MKHLRKFNEGKLEDIKELSEDYLVYLTDKDFIYEIRDMAENIEISISKEIPRQGDSWRNLIPIQFNWDDIKDRIIPFLIILKRDYTIDSVNFNLFIKKEPTEQIIRILNDERYKRQMDDGWIRGNIKNTADDLINDKVENIESMTSLTISISTIQFRRFAEPKKPTLFNKFIKRFL